MRNAILIILVFVSFSFQSNTLEETYSLTITVTNLRNSSGVVQFALYNQEGSIPDEKFKHYYIKKTAAIVNNKATITFDNLPKGWYAINVLHDENKNEKIDKGFLLPKEGIGFSNYTKIGLTNRPRFEKAKFELNTNTTKEVTIIYF